MVYNEFLISYVTRFCEFRHHLHKLLLVFWGELMKCVKTPRSAQIIKVINR